MRRAFFSSSSFSRLSHDPSPLSRRLQVFPGILAGSAGEIIPARKIIREGKPVPRVYHTCGADDHIKRIAYRTKAFFESFEGNPFDYVYEEDPGKHTWDYWDEHIQRFLGYIGKK